MHLLRIRRHCHVRNRQHCTDSEFAWTLSCFISSLLISSKWFCKQRFLFNVFTFLVSFRNAFLTFFYSCDERFCIYAVLFAFKMNSEMYGGQTILSTQHLKHRKTIRQPGLCPDPTGSLQRSPDPLACGRELTTAAPPQWLQPRFSPSGLANPVPNYPPTSRYPPTPLVSASDRITNPAIKIFGPEGLEPPIFEPWSSCNISAPLIIHRWNRRRCEALQ